MIKLHQIFDQSTERHRDGRHNYRASPSFSCSGWYGWWVGWWVGWCFRKCKESPERWQIFLLPLKISARDSLQVGNLVAVR